MEKVNLNKGAALIFILLLATFLRLYQLNRVPPSPSLDEVSLGYNAYSILKTGRDEYGTKLPLILRAYDDFRPALYAYLIIPFLPIFGLSVLAVRLPAVILSLVTVGVTYLLANELWSPPKKISTGPIEINAGLMASLLLAISPWHVYLSRLGHETNLGLTLVVLGVYFFVMAIKKKNMTKFLTLSLSCFALSLVSYQSQKVVVPVLGLALLAIFYRRLWAEKRKLLLPAIIFLLLVVPLVFISLTPEAMTRLKGSSAFADHPLYDQTLPRYLTAKERGDLFGLLVNHPRIVGLRIFWGNYLSHFSPQWLFWGSPYESHKVPNLGLLYFWELPLLLLGIIAIFLGRVALEFKLLLLAWGLTAPLPAGITSQAPHAMRSFTFLPVWQILGGAGLVYLLNRVPRALQRAMAGVFIVVVAGSLFYLYQQYFVVFPKTQSASFQYALNQAIPWVLARAGGYNKIVFSNQDSLYQSYMFFLFHSRYDPRLYQQQGGTYSGGYAVSHQIGRFEFRPINWGREEQKGKTLWVGNLKDFPPQTNTLLLVQNLDGTAAVKVVGE